MGGAGQRVGAGKGAGPLSDKAPNWGGEWGEASGNQAGQWAGADLGAGRQEWAGLMLGPQGVDAAKDWVREGTRDRGGEVAAGREVFHLGLARGAHCSGTCSLQNNCVRW